ncbi:CBN-PSD-1 protein [Caenorhabditis brenneri]|uniref:Phosphatidylserine decarboxylase proenzyme, mitochondrial n=1 Tax=Caenorhabditis brenneri TaxID=135651 RepID=G0MG82_CAEBE|nr:CBN-PSD-1 protein [Caenorhabditis brenneri]
MLDIYSGGFLHPDSVMAINPFLVFVAIWSWVKWLSVSTLIIGGSAYIGYLFTPDWREIVDSKHYYSNWKIRVYLSLPFNTASRVIGGLANQEIPVWLREYLLGGFARMYDCRMEDCVDPDFKNYPSFAAFFNRKLKESTRPISASPLVSPADGTVLHFGKVEENKIEYVKGHDYDVDKFLGEVELEAKDELELYQVVIYLAPGDYHAFHSPARWVANQCRHVPGLLLSVRPTLLSHVPHLFCLNERVVLNGSWRHGFFSMSAVAATNVGDIVVDAEPSLRTNIVRRKTQKIMNTETEIHAPYLPGERVGEFRLGSTIVLVFQAPPTIKFAIKAGDPLRYGQSLVADGV